MNFKYKTWEHLAEEQQRVTELQSQLSGKEQELTRMREQFHILENRSRYEQHRVTELRIQLRGKEQEITTMNEQ